MLTEAERLPPFTTVIFKVSLSEQEPFVEETIYMVVADGVATGFAIVELDNPVVGVHT